MALLDLFANTVEVRRNNPGATDAYNLPTGNVDTVVAQYAARVQHHNSWEDREGRQVSVQGWRVYLPPGADVTEDDQIYWVDQGRLFEILVVEPVYAGAGSSVHHKYCMLQEIF